MSDEKKENQVKTLIEQIKESEIFTSEQKEALQEIGNETLSQLLKFAESIRDIPNSIYEKAFLDQAPNFYFRTKNENGEDTIKYDYISHLKLFKQTNQAFASFLDQEQKNSD